MVTFPKQHYFELVERAVIRLGHRRPTLFSASIDAKRRAQLARFQKKGFYERGCQVKTLLLLQEGLVFVGIQPPADELDDFECKGSAVVFPFASVRVESSSELRQAWGRD